MRDPGNEVGRERQYTMLEMLEDTIVITVVVVVVRQPCKDGILGTVRGISVGIS